MMHQRSDLFSIAFSSRGMIHFEELVIFLKRFLTSSSKIFCESISKTNKAKTPSLYSATFSSIIPKMFSDLSESEFVTLWLLSIWRILNSSNFAFWNLMMKMGQHLPNKRLIQGGGRLGWGGPHVPQINSAVTFSI